VVVRRFGAWPIAEQLAGILVVPDTDDFVAGPHEDLAADVRDGTWGWAWPA
jgi:hypothetical protein